MTTQPTPQATAPSAAFANEIIEIAFEGGDLDGAEIQDIAVKHGLLTIQIMTEPCGEHCGCQENCADFPTECYRKTYPTTDLRAELSAMTAERDKWKAEFAQQREHVMQLSASTLKAIEDRDKWQTAHADTLAELRKVSEELGALKGECAEIQALVTEKKASLESAFKTIDYKYFGDYELSENQWDAVFALEGFAKSVLAITAQGEKP